MGKILKRFLKSQGLVEHRKAEMVQAGSILIFPPPIGLTGGLMDGNNQHGNTMGGGDRSWKRARRRRRNRQVKRRREHRGRKRISMARGHGKTSAGSCTFGSIRSYLPRNH